MADDFNQFPINDSLIRKDSMKMSESWISSMTTFWQTINNYLSQFGFFIPVVTTDQIASIQSPIEGQMIYNIDYTVGPPRTANILIWQVKAGIGAWRVVQTV